MDFDLKLRHKAQGTALAAILLCTAPSALAQAPSSIRSAGLTEEEESALNRRIDYSAEQARIQALLARRSERDAQIAIGRIFVERAWASLESGHYHLAGRYALAGSRFAPANEADFRAVLARILFDANDSTVLHQRTRNSNFDSAALAALSPDGSRVVVGSGDGTVRLYDAATSTEINEFVAHSRQVGRIVFSADSSKYATISWDGVAWVFRTSDGARLLNIVPPAPPAEEEDEEEEDYGGAIRGVGGAPEAAPLIGVGFTPDGTRLLTTNDRGVIRTWDIARAREMSTREARLELDVHGRPGLDLPSDQRPTREDLRELQEMEESATHPYMREAVFSPDGSMLASIDGGGDIQVFRVRDGREVQHFRERDGNFWNLAFSPDGRRLLTGSYGLRFDHQPARVWDIETGAEVIELSAHRGAVFSVAYSSDGGLIATASADRTARIWDATTGRTIAVMRGHSRGLESVSLSSGGQSRLVTVGEEGVARLWQSATGRELGTLSGGPPPDEHTTMVHFSQDGQRLLAATSGGLRLWDLPTRRQIGLVDDEAGLHPFDWSPQGDRIVGGRGPPNDGDAVIVSSDGGRVIASIAGHHDPQLFAGSLSSVDFSPDGARILSVGHDGFSRMWNAESGRLIFEVRGGGGGGHFSPNGQRFVVSNAGCLPSDCRGQVRDAADGRLLFELRGHTDTIEDEQFDATTRRIVTASRDGTARIWDAETGQELLALRGHESDVVGAMFSPEGSHVLTFSYDHTTRLWDAASGREVARYTNSDGVHGAVLAPDGQAAAISLPQRGVLLWDVSRFSEPFAHLAHDACTDFLIGDQQVFSSVEISSDPLLRDAWLQGAETRSVCEAQP